MAQCSQTAYDFVQSSFGPMIAVLCTEDAEITCQKNHLSFVELIKPFSQLTSEAHIRDPLNQTHPVKSWKLCFVELSAPNPSKEVVNQLLSDVVARTVEQQNKAVTPWFEAFRDCFIQMIKPSDHEYIRHFLGCLFVVSSTNSDPLNAFQSLSTALDNQQPSDTIHSKWFSSNIFKYYLMVHDITDGEQNKADGIYQSMKSFYGSSFCHMLMINSRKPEQYSPNLPDPWAQFIISTGKGKYDEPDSNEVILENNIDEENTISDNIVVDENYDPLTAAVQNNIDGNSSPVFIDPLSFNNDENIRQDSTIVDGTVNHTSGYQNVVPRQFSGGLLSQSSGGGNKHRGACLTLSDHDRIRIFIHELAIRGLLPFIERTMKSLYDHIMARKGLPKSFFHATKKWFGGGKPTAQVTESLVPGIVYTSDSPELYWRKLGDLAFLVQNYDLAYNCYHTAKRDFNTNHAWLYFAGALEMATVSAFMAGGQRQYPSHYMETSISTYVDACRQHQFATRATLFSAEAFKDKGMFSEAAYAFLKMTGEESDLLSAIFLEQAAHCFLHTKPVRHRKYAFNMILAGHRYIKATQRKHALRCYKRALSIYHDKSWSMAEDHINFIVGRQSSYLRHLDDALHAFQQLLVGESLQNADQQTAYLREFLLVFQQLRNQKQPDSIANLPVLPLPKLDANSTRIIFTYDDVTSPGDRGQRHNATSQHLGLYAFEEIPKISSTKWNQIEDETYRMVNKGLGSCRCFVPCLTKNTDNSLRPRAVINETIGVEVTLINELKIPLTLSNLSLLWTFSPENAENEGQGISNELKEEKDVVHTQVTEEFVLSGNQRKTAHLCIKPQCKGNIKITGIKYNLSSVNLSGSNEATVSNTTAAVSLYGKLDILIQGPRLNNTKEERSSVIYGIDNRLNISVIGPMPQLQVSLTGLPRTLLCGEIRTIKALFSNKGEGSLHRLHMAATTTNMFTIDGAQDLQLEKQGNTMLRRLSQIPLPNALPPGETAEFTMWAQGHVNSGIYNENLLFYYESMLPSPSLSYRAVRHESSIRTSKSLAVRATAKRSKETRKDNNKTDVEENNQLVLALEVENLTLPDAQFRSFTVLQVSSVSKYWVIETLDEKADEIITINQGETVMTHFRALRRKAGSDLQISNVCFTGNEIDISKPPYSEFFYRSKTWHELEQGDDATDVSMCVAMGVLVLWESSYIDAELSKHTVRGQSQVAIVTLAESISAPVIKQSSTRLSIAPAINETSNTGTPELYVKYSVHNPGRITHSFQKRRSCLVRVDVVLHNCSQHTVKTFVEMSKTTEKSTNDSRVTRENDRALNSISQSTVTSSDYMNCTAAFTWLGKSSRQVTMAAGETVTLTFNAKVFKSGVYKMNTCGVMAALARDPNSSPVLQKQCPASLVVVIDSDLQHPDSDNLEQDLFALFDVDQSGR